VVPDQRRVEEPDAAGSACSEAVRLELLAAVLETVDTGVVACDADGHLTLFNTAARRFHGLDHDPAVDSSRWAQHFDLYDADHGVRLRPQEVPLYRALVDGRVSGTVIRIAPPGSPPRYVRCHGQQLRDADGTVTGAVVAMTDVTEARHAATALLRQRELAASLVAASREAYVCTDERGQITTWNPAAEALLGITAQDAVGRDLVALAPAALSPAYRGWLRTYLRDGATHTDPVEDDLTLTHARGHDLPLRVTMWAQSTDAGWRCHAYLRQGVAAGVSGGPPGSGR
jgi:PAS domain S-box-containing protein